LSTVREVGDEIKVSDDDRLVIDAPRRAITPQLRRALASHKPELLQILKTEETAEISAPTHKPSEPVAAVVEETRPPQPAAAHAGETKAPAAGSEEISQLEAELLRLRTEENARRAEV